MESLESNTASKGVDSGDLRSHPAWLAVAFIHEHARARATGCWRYQDGHLILEAFIACPEMSPAVAKGFPVATADVPVTETGLGIVLAARTLEVTEYRAIDLPPDAGSGFWLRGFEADRSIAVPRIDSSGSLVRILSVAVQGIETPVAKYERIVRSAYARHLP